MAEERFSLKDALFNEESVGRLADMIDSAHPDFDRDRFMGSVMSAMPTIMRGLVGKPKSRERSVIPSRYSCEESCVVSV